MKKILFKIFKMVNELEAQIGEAIVPEKVIDAYSDMNAIVAFIKRNTSACVYPTATTKLCGEVGIAPNRYNSRLILSIVAKYFELEAEQRQSAIRNPQSAIA